MPAKIDDLAEQLPGALASPEVNMTGFRAFLDTSGYADAAPPWS